MFHFTFGDAHNFRVAKKASDRMSGNTKFLRKFLNNFRELIFGSNRSDEICSPGSRRQRSVFGQKDAA